MPAPGDPSATSVFTRGADLRLFQAAPAALVLCDAQGRTLAINDAARALADRVLAASIDAWCDDQGAATLRELRRSADPAGNAVHAGVRARDGRMLDVACRRIRDPARGEAWLLALADASARERRLLDLDRARLRAQEGESAVRSVLVLAGHELRTPLTAIQGALDLLDDLARAPADRDILALARDALATQLAEIDGLLDAARPDSAAPIMLRALHPAEALAEAVESVSLMLRDQAGRIRYAAEEGVQAVEGDPLRLRQVLVNLLCHACRMAAPGTAIRAAVMPGDGADGAGFRCEIAAVTAGGVADTGTRVDEGLGIIIARQLCERMGGRCGSERDGDETVWWASWSWRPSSGWRSRLPDTLELAGTRAWVATIDEDQGRSLVQMLGGLGVAAQWLPDVGGLRLQPPIGRQLLFIDPGGMPVADALAGLHRPETLAVELLPVGQRAGRVPQALASCLLPATPGRLAGALMRVHQVLALRTAEPGSRAYPVAEGWDDVQSLIDAMPEHVAVLDPYGTIRAVNRRWRQFADGNGANGSDGFVGGNYLDACWRACQAGDEDALRVVSALKEVLAGRREAMAHEYPCHSPEEHRWFMVYASAMRTRSGEPRGAVIMHLDITLRRKIAYDQDRIIAELREQLDLMLAAGRRDPDAG